MAKEDLFYGQGFETEDRYGVFDRLSRMILSNEVRIGNDAGFEGPDGGNLAALTPPNNSPESPGAEVLPSLDEQHLQWGGSLGVSSQATLELVASDK